MASATVTLTDEEREALLLARIAKIREEVAKDMQEIRDLMAEREAVMAYFGCKPRPATSHP